MMFPKRSLLNMLAVFFCLSSFALLAGPPTQYAQRPQNQTVTTGIPATWQKALDELIATGEAPGAMIMVKSPDWGVRFGSSGKANLKTPVPFSEHTPFRIGSVSKVFTAVMILQMEQEGLLRLTDTLDKYLSGNRAFKYNADKITVAECLVHTGGMADYLADPFYNDFPYSDRYESSNKTTHIPPETLVAQVNNQSPHFNPGDTYANPFAIYQGFWASSVDPNTPPPKTEDVMAHPQKMYLPEFETWGYSNGHYLALGLIIEAIEKRPIHEVMKSRIVDRLGLRNTWFATDASVPANTMRGYSKLDARIQPFDPPQTEWVDRTEVTPTNAWAAGAVISSTADLITFAEALYTGYALINQGTRAKLMRFVEADFSFPHTKYGFGALMRVDEPYGTLYGHGGAFPGSKTLMEYIPAWNLFFATGTNTGDTHFEVEVLEAIMPLIAGAATTPYPPNQSVGAPSMSSLHWQPGLVYGDKYDVYMGFAPDQLAKAGTVTETHFKPPGLIPGRYYFWRVDTIEGSKVYEGPTWSFSVY